MKNEQAFNKKKVDAGGPTTRFRVTDGKGSGRVDGEGREGRAAVAGVEGRRTTTAGEAAGRAGAFVNKKK
jgi:hypothetical protein